MVLAKTDVSICTKGINCSVRIIPVGVANWRSPAPVPPQAALHLTNIPGFPPAEGTKPALYPHPYYKHTCPHDILERIHFTTSSKQHFSLHKQAW